MTYARTYFRDTIVLNNAFKTRLRLEGLPAGDVLIAARKVTVDGALDIPGRNLVILADRSARGRLAGIPAHARGVLLQGCQPG